MSAPLGNSFNKYTIEQIKVLIAEYIEHRKKGYSKESFPDCDYRTIETHLSNSPDELQSEIELLKKAEREARKYWEGLGIKLITGDLNGSAPAWMFNMKNRFKEDWKDKVETGFTDSQGKDVAPVQIYIPSNGRDNTPAQRQPE
jgi:hypothetical protein